MPYTCLHRFHSVSSTLAKQQQVLCVFLHWRCSVQYQGQVSYVFILLDIFGHFAFIWFICSSSKEPEGKRGTRMGYNMQQKYPDRLFTSCFLSFTSLYLLLLRTSVVFLFCSNPFTIFNSFWFLAFSLFLLQQFTPTAFMSLLSLFLTQNWLYFLLPLFIIHNFSVCKGTMYHLPTCHSIYTTSLTLAWTWKERVSQQA